MSEYKPVEFYGKGEILHPVHGYLMAIFPKKGGTLLARDKKTHDLFVAAGLEKSTAVKSKAGKDV